MGDDVWVPTWADEYGDFAPGDLVQNIRHKDADGTIGEVQHFAYGKVAVNYSGGRLDGHREYANVRDLVRVESAA